MILHDDIFGNTLVSIIAIGHSRTSVTANGVLA